MHYIYYCVAEAHDNDTQLGVLPDRHYSDVIMSAMASQITDVSIVCSTVNSDADQRKHQSSSSLAFVRWPVNSPHKGPETRKMLTSSWVTGWPTEQKTTKNNNNKQGRHQNSVLLALYERIPPWPVSLEMPVMQKRFSCHDVFMHRHFAWSDVTIWNWQKRRTGRDSFQICCRVCDRQFGSLAPRLRQGHRFNLNLNTIGLLYKAVQCITIHTPS